MAEENTIVDKLLAKSKEAFIMAIEIYNKPTIRYRVEGFSFFICNAWELMLKAHLINEHGEDAIYFRDNPNRTLPLEVCVRKVFTNEKSPIYLNLSKIIELRNTSTHFIVEEYEMVYIPLFQANIFNFIEKMDKFHGIDMTTVIPQNFISLAVSMYALNDAELRAKYPGQIAEKLIHTKDQLAPMITENNQTFAIRIDHYHYITKDRSKATEFVHIDKTAEAGVQIIKDIKDPNDVYKYNQKNAVKEIKRRLERRHITLLYKGEPKEFNKWVFKLFVDYYGMKSNSKFCYAYQQTSSPLYSYSMSAIELIVEEIKKDPEHIIQNLKQRLKK